MADLKEKLQHGSVLIYSCCFCFIQIEWKVPLIKGRCDKMSIIFFGHRQYGQVCKEQWMALHSTAKFEVCFNLEKNSILLARFFVSVVWCVNLNIFVEVMPKARFSQHTNDAKWLSLKSSINILFNESMGLHRTPNVVVLCYHLLSFLALVHFIPV